MNHAIQLIDKAKKLDIRLTIKINFLAINAPKNIWTQEIRDEFKQHKNEIIRILTKQQLPRLSIFEVTLAECNQVTVLSRDCHELETFIRDMEDKFGAGRVVRVKLRNQIFGRPN